MELHFQIKLDCYTHVLNSIGLSATYASDNPFIERMMKTAYPTDTRLKNLKLDKYADAFAVYYRIGDNQWLRTQEHGSNNYSHIAFEKSILKNTRWRKNYFKLIGDLVENTYIPLKREKKVAAVFASSVEMCSQLRAYLQDRFPKQIVKRYVQDDPVEHIYSCDILVTTVLSAGTAIDIPDLTSVYLTIAISSTQANIQTFGRLRKLADHKTEFYYLTCTDVAKHMEYDVNKRKMLKERAKSTHDYHTGVIL
jgi:small basic protein